MEFSKIKLAGAGLIETEPFCDHRGKFGRLFCQNKLKDILQGNHVEQINHSLTLKTGTVRGMHFQIPPKAEIKLVRCLKGKVFDVIVDLRQASQTFLQWHGEILYLHTDSYSPEYEAGLRYDEPRVAIKWPLDVVEVSDRDRKFALLSREFAGIDA